jgi:UDP-GlcNAc:undecaprenyl-phosphate/decaprenyl-phosphate GlcNAc-1-phosphate transferase
MLVALVVLAIAAGSGLLLTPWVIRLAVAWGLYDAPHGERRVHTEPLPRLGGVAVVLAMCGGLAALAAASAAGLETFTGRPGFFFGVLFGGGIVFATGLVDDLRGLTPTTKLLAQVVAALIVYLYGFRIDLISIGSLTEVPLGWLALPLTVLWVVTVTNAFNLIDGLDGLATGIAMVALATTLIVSISVGNPEAILLITALLGALLGFFRYNVSPARIFLGDSGSLFIGFMLAILSVHGSYKSATALLLLMPLFALAVPLVDTTLAVLRRWLRGAPLSQADGRHIHHRLLAAGLSHRHAVWVLHFAAIVLALFGLSLVFAPPPALVSIAAAGGGVTLIVLVWGVKRLQYHEFSEAGNAVITGIHRLRRVIRDQISAQDIGEQLRKAGSLQEISAILEDHSGTFGFLRMEVCRESTTGTRPLVLFHGHAARALKLDYPVMSYDFAEGNDYVLRIWCNPTVGRYPYGAERVAQILAPVIEQQLVEIGAAVTDGGRGGQAGDAPAARDFEEGLVQQSDLERMHAGRVSAGVRT